MNSFIQTRSSARRWDLQMVKFFSICAALLAAVLTFAASPSLATETEFDPRSEIMPVGHGVFEVGNISRGPVSIYTYRPQAATRNSPIWIVMPGARRDAHRSLAFDYYDTWQPLAEQYNAILLVPDFTAEKWPGSWTYNMGNVRGRDLRAKPWRQTSFYVVEEAFRMASHSLGNHHRKFSMFGHGAGAQFIQRYILHTGGHLVHHAVAANPGWYLVPDDEFRFPFGLRDAPIDNATLRRAFATKFTLLLGAADVNYARLRNDRDARAQGKTRYDRGIFYYHRSQSIAARMGATFNWRLMEVPGVAHEAKRMAPTAAKLLAGAAVAAR